MKTYKVFVINPGSTSTKVAMFEGTKKVYSENIQHSAKELKSFKEVWDQLGYRKEKILEGLAKSGMTLDGVDAISSRGGGIGTVESGVYTISSTLLDYARIHPSVVHPAILGAPIAHALAEKYGAKAFVVNPPEVDEFQHLARVTGLKGVYRHSSLHALNQKEIALRYAAKIGRSYDSLRLIICHLGGGISVTAHSLGKMIDSNDIAGGDGPMAPTRCGTLPVRDVIEMCFSGRYTAKEMYQKMTKTGGLVDHLGTADAREVKARADAGDAYARLIYDAMIYQIGKEVGAMAAVLHGKADAIILTGGISYDEYVTSKLKEMIGFIAPVEVMAGEFEMEALAAGAIRVLKGEEIAKDFTGKPVWNGFSFAAK
ncbi:MAG: butyrate kinase [Acidaminococcus sp.]|jgi:butyrate kinase|nr:butyrate kinase [Acidaminococcus sp.]MCI2099624.1 butyrate kinase [Acidaminococcus sp.]MCI2113709.1 butyrate kinase [Acidaminococcus sp.]MCI2115792.1 butyrate kinase [Acidaminococcus sp.]